MKVILVEKVPTLGNVGDVVNVRAGHARNFLIPNKKAIIADESNRSQLNHLNRMLAQKVTKEQQEAEKVKEKLDGLTLQLNKKVGGSGKLFGTVTTTDLARELEKLGLDVERRLLVVENPIKSLGDHSVKAKLFKDVVATFTVKVERDAQEAEKSKPKRAAKEK